MDSQSVHALEIIVESVLAENFQAVVCVQQRNGRMLDAIKHIGLYGSVVNHVFEDDVLPYPQAHGQIAMNR